jgi:hypothetical protein
MGNPSTWRGCCLSSAALERTDLMVGKFANRIRAVPFHRIRLSCNPRHSPSGWWRERRPALSQVAPSPNINSVRSIAGELRRLSLRVVAFQLEILL